MVWRLPSSRAGLCQLAGVFWHSRVMRTSPLGHSELHVTSLTLGTMTFGKEADEDTSRALLNQYLEAGGNIIDTADVYAMGVSEEIIGRWLADSGKRDDVIIATKARFAMSEGGPRGLHPDYLRGAIEDNLRRLNIDTIDLFQPHTFDPNVPVSEWLGLIKQFIDEGKIRYLGVSNFLSYQLQHTLDVAKYEGLPTVVSLQPQYNLLDRHIDYEIMDVCRNNDIPLLPWSPLGGGWLSGKYQRDRLPTGSTRLGENPSRGVEAYDKRNTERTFDILDVVKDIAGAHGVSMAQVSLAWLVQHPQVGSVILGARNSEQLADNLAAAQLSLSGEQWQRLEEVSRPHTPDYPYGFADRMGGR